MSAVKKAKQVEPADDEAVQKNVLILPAAKIELCAARGDVRFYLNWPYLDLSDKKKPMLVATNGHILAAAPVTVGKDVKAGPLPLAAIKAARSVKTRQPSLGAKLIFEGEMVGTGDVMYRRPNGDFTYPDWRKVVPSMAKDRKPDIGVNGAYVKVMQDVFGTNKDTGSNYGGVAMFCQRDGEKIDASKGMLFRSINPNTLDVIGVVMPMRI